MAKKVETKYGLVTLKELKDYIYQTLEKSEKPLHYQQICRILNCKDDSIVTHILDILEMDERIEAAGEEQIIQPDGLAMTIGTYKIAEAKTS